MCLSKAYLMTVEKMTLEKAYWHVKDRRAIAYPNGGFKKHLIALEKKLFGKTSIDENSYFWPQTRPEEVSATNVASDNGDTKSAASFPTHPLDIYAVVAASLT